MDVSKLSAKACKEMLQKIVDELDELDNEDYFGTEGWKHRFGIKV